MAISCGDVQLKNKCLDLLYECCFHMNLDIKEVWNVYVVLLNQLFVDDQARITGTIDKLYQLIFQRILESVTIPCEPVDSLRSNLVILVTNQFLNAMHSPTRRILDYAYALNQNLHKSVLIVNSACYHNYRHDYIVQDFMYSFDESFNGFQSLEWKNAEISFMQIPVLMPDINCINDTLLKLYKLQPQLVYGIGDSNLLTDLCSAFTKTACIKCGSEMPVSMSEYLLLGRHLVEGDGEFIARLQPYQKVIETKINYQVPEEDSVYYDRSSFGLKEEDFVIGVVGNRLNSEVTKEFLYVLDQMADKLKVHILLIGDIEAKRIQDAVRNRENFHFSGQIVHAFYAMKVFDIYCNPKRKGGGRSSFEALANGVPVITLRYGDVYHTCGDFFAVDQLEDFLPKIEELRENEEIRALWKKESYKRAGILSDIAGTQKAVLDQIFGDNAEKKIRG